LRMWEDREERIITPGALQERGMLQDIFSETEMEARMAAEM
jgi:hypothetical protein